MRCSVFLTPDLPGQLLETPALAPNADDLIQLVFSDHLSVFARRTTEICPEPMALVIGDDFWFGFVTAGEDGQLKICTSIGSATCSPTEVALYQVVQVKTDYVSEADQF